MGCRSRTRSFSFFASKVIYQKRMIRIEIQRDDFITNGYCYFEGVIPAGEVERIRQSVVRDVWAHNLLERPTGYVPGFLRFNQDVAPHLTGAHPTIAESFFGANVRMSMVSGIVNGFFIPRGALDSDWPYKQTSAAHVPAPCPDAEMHIVTMWMLTDFTTENGGTIVEPRSHKQTCHPLDQPAMKPWPGETQFTGKAGTVAAFDARLWLATSENRTYADRVAVLVPYAPWWLSLHAFRPGTVDHHDIVERNGGKDSVVPPLAREEREAAGWAKRLLPFSVSQ